MTRLSGQLGQWRFGGVIARAHVDIVWPYLDEWSKGELRRSFIANGRPLEAAQAVGYMGA